MKKVICMIITFAVICTVFTFETEASNSIDVFIDGNRADLNAMAKIVDGKIYVSLRIIAAALGADDVLWNRDTLSAEIYFNDITVKLSAGMKYIEAEGRYFYTSRGCIYNNGYVMVPLEELCRSIGADIAFSFGDAYIVSPDKPFISADEVYNSDDLYWLARIIHAEAQGEIFEGKIAVGNVVMNRLSSQEFPGNIYDIIFDNSCGEQFSPAWNGAIYCTPTEESIIAAKIALEGCDITGGCLYFAASHIAEICWAGKNRPYVTQIENHVFFA